MASIHGENYQRNLGDGKQEMWRKDITWVRAGEMFRPRKKYRILSVEILS